MARQCSIDGCGRNVQFQITVETESGEEYQIPVCPNHNE